MPGRTIYSSIWDEPWFHAFGPDGKLLFLYFVTSPLANPSGIYSILPGLIAAHIGLRGVRLDRALDAIRERCLYDADDGVVWVKNFLRVQAGEVKAGSKFLISALNHALRGPQRFLRDFLEHNRDLLGGLSAYPTDTLSVGYREGIDAPEGLVPPSVPLPLPRPRSGTDPDLGREGAAVAPRVLRAAPPTTPDDKPVRASWPAERAALQAIPGYPLDEGRDRELLDSLAELYGQLDLAREIRALKAWLASKNKLPLRGQTGPRSRVRNWMRKADEINADRGARDGDRGKGASSNLIRRGDGQRAAESWERRRVQRAARAGAVPPLRDAPESPADPAA